MRFVSLGLPHNDDLVWLGNEGKKRMTKSRRGRLAKAEWNPTIGAKVALIEVKSGKPTLESVGQILVYRALFQQDYPQCPVEQLWIIARQDDAQVRIACEELGISVWTEDRDRHRFIGQLIRPFFVSKPGNIGLDWAFDHVRKQQEDCQHRKAVRS